MKSDFILEKKSKGQLRNNFKKKSSIMEYLLVLFFITGGIGYSDEVINILDKNINIKVEPNSKLLLLTDESEKITLEYSMNFLEKEKREEILELKRMSILILKELSKNNLEEINDILKLKVENKNSVENLIKEYNLKYKNNLKLVAIKRRVDSKSKQKKGYVFEAGILASGAIAIAEAENSLLKNNNSDKNSNVEIIEEEKDNNNKIVIKDEAGMKASGIGEQIEFNEEYEVQENGVGLISEGENSKIINKGKILVNSSSGIGMQVLGNKGIAENKNEIIVNNGIGIDSSIVDSLIIQEKDLMVNTGIGILSKGEYSTVANSDNAKIVVNGNGSVGIESRGNVTNRGEIIVNGGIGINLTTDSKGSTNQTQGNITVSNGGTGIKVNPGNGRFDNYGKMSVIGKTSIGIYSEGIARNYGGTIELSNATEGGTGMKSGTGGVSINKGIILGLPKTSTKYSVAMEAIGGNVTNEVDGKITGTFAYGMIARKVGARAINKGEISASGYDAMNAYEGSEVINETSGKITGDINFAMYASGKNSKVINKGEIKTYYGIKIHDGATGINEIGGVISNTDSFGIKVTGKDSTAINRGIISNEKSFGIEVSDSGTAINEITGIISNNGANGMILSGSTSRGLLINKGLLANKGNYGMIVNTTSATGINEGTISNIGNDGMRVESNSSSVTNEKNGIISNEGNSGMSGINGTIINKGLISNKGIKGIEVSGVAIVTNEVDGIIKNTSHIGISVNKVTGINKGRIENGGDYGTKSENAGNMTNDVSGVIMNKGHYGMYALGKGAIITNNGIISNDGDYGMFVDGSGALGVNNGMISNGGSNKTGTANGGTITNNNVGKIYVDRDNGVGMTANGSGSTAINKGAIIMSGNNQKGMVATNGGSIINDAEGEIYLSSANNSTGLYASGVGSIVKNEGTIYLDNETVKGSTSNLSGPASSQGNQAILLENGAIFINKGLFSVTGDLDSADMGDSSQFVLEGGTVEADTVRGDYYASGALAWGSPEVTREDGTLYRSTEYENQYDTYQMFKTDNMYADMYSNSAMFDVALTEQDSNGYYGINMYRKSFYDIIDNQEFAQYLETNYTETGKTEQRTDLYEAYKLVTNTSDLNKAVRNTFGETIYPTIMEQNFKIARLNNTKMKEEIFNKKSNSEVGDYNYIGYSTYQNTKDRKSDNFSENDMKYSSVSLGLDKKINQTTRVGILGTVGKTDIKFTDEAKRKDDVYQVNLFSIYEKNSIKGTANLYAGKIQGDLDRKLAITSVYEEMNADTESNFYGLNLSLEKQYSFKGLNLSPRVELNTMYMEEDKVRENGKYALDVDGINGKSIDTGIGFTANKTVYFEKGYNVIPELTAMYYRELGNQYKDRAVKLNSVSNDIVHIQGYEEGKDTGELNISLLAQKEGFGIRVGVSYEVNDQGENITPYVNLGYIF